jgi:hypothetical protein
MDGMIEELEILSRSRRIRIRIRWHWRRRVCASVWTKPLLATRCPVRTWAMLVTRRRSEPGREMDGSPWPAGSQAIDTK